MSVQDSLDLIGRGADEVLKTDELRERAVRIDGTVVEDAQLTLAPGFEGVLAVGKRTFARVRLVAA